MKAIIAKKLGMTRIFDEKGKVIPVTMLLVNDNVVTQVKTDEKDGYSAVQIGLIQDRKINKPLAGHLKDLTKTNRLKEFSIDGLNVGDKIDLKDFQVGDKVSVSAISKGKGFAGTVKRHHFNTGPKTHGSDNYRRPGSIGMTGPQRVVKGRRMAGHLGYDKTTVKNLPVSAIIEDKNMIMVRGAVPGPNNTTVYVWSENGQN